MKKLKIFICGFLIYGVGNIGYSQCPITFPKDGNVCLEGTAAADLICLQNASGNLNLLFNGTNKYTFLKSGILGIGYPAGQIDSGTNIHVKSSIGFGLSTGSQSNFRIDHVISPSNPDVPVTYFRTFQKNGYIDFSRLNPVGQERSLFGIDGALNTGGLVYVYDNTNTKKVQLSGTTERPTFFMGNVLIGADNPATGEKLEVTGDAKVTGMLKLGNSSNNASLRITNGGGPAYQLESTPGCLVMSPSGGRVIISEASNTALKSLGTTNTNYMLLVQKGILTEKVKVAVSTTNSWSDHVFAEDYTLKSLDEVEDYIKKNEHLPNIPSAKTLVAEGLDLGEMQARQMEKIEELTLYMIEMKKQIDLLKKENSELRKMVSK